MRLLLIDETRVFAESLADRLQHLPWVDEAVVATHPESAFDLAGDGRSWLALLNWSIPNSRWVASALSETYDTPVIALRVGKDGCDILQAAEAGVLAFVSKEATFEDLVEVMEASLRGETICSPRVAAMLVRHIRRLASQLPRARAEVRLTPREHEILGLIAEGRANKDIAAALSIEVRTVKNHVHNLMDKLGAGGRVEAVARARTLFGWSPS
jgi:two-component system nitrate/nitrite response regulator NarL